MHASSVCLPCLLLTGAVCSPMQTMAESWLQAADPNVYALHDIHAEWRPRPMTDMQRALLIRHGVQHDEHWTRGQASTELTRHLLQVITIGRLTV